MKEPKQIPLVVHEMAIERCQKLLSALLWLLAISVCGNVAAVVERKD